MFPLDGDLLELHVVARSVPELDVLVNRRVGRSLERVGQALDAAVGAVSSAAARDQVFVRAAQCVATDPEQLHTIRDFEQALGGDHRLVWSAFCSAFDPEYEEMHRRPVKRQVRRAPRPGVTAAANQEQHHHEGLTSSGGSSGGSSGSRRTKKKQRRRTPAGQEPSAAASSGKPSSSTSSPPCATDSAIDVLELIPGLEENGTGWMASEGDGDDHVAAAPGSLDYTPSDSPGSSPWEEAVLWTAVLKLRWVPNELWKRGFGDRVHVFSGGRVGLLFIDSARQRAAAAANAARAAAEALELAQKSPYHRTEAASAAAHAHALAQESAAAAPSPPHSPARGAQPSGAPHSPDQRSLNLADSAHASLLQPVVGYAQECLFCVRSDQADMLFRLSPEFAHSFGESPFLLVHSVDRTKRAAERGTEPGGAKAAGKKSKSMLNSCAVQ